MAKRKRNPVRFVVRAWQRYKTVGAIMLVLVLLSGAGWFVWQERPHSPQPLPAALTETTQLFSSLAQTTQNKPQPTPAGVANVLRPFGDHPNLGAFSAVITDADTGQLLWERHRTETKIPASVIKVLTAAAALLALPLDQRLTTEVVAGDQPGQIVLVAGGDPTLSIVPGTAPGYYHGAAQLADLTQQIKAANIQVQSIVIDTSKYEGPTLAQGWFETDIPGGSVAATEPIMVEGARTDPSQILSPRSTSPAKDVGVLLAAQLGLPATAVSFGKQPAQAQQIAAVQSAPLRMRMHQMLEESDNVLAEAIGREIASAKGRPASFTGAAEAILAVLQEAGINTQSTQLFDASGLSIDNRAVPDVFNNIMLAAVRQSMPDLAPLLDMLPVASATGSLMSRFQDPQRRSGAGWVRAKTGTMDQVNTLTGYLIDKDGKILTFALLSNGSPAFQSRPVLDAITANLRACGCGTE